MSLTTGLSELKIFNKRNKESLSVKETAELLGITQQATRRKCRKGDIRSWKFLGEWKISREAVKKLLKGEEHTPRKRVSKRLDSNITVSPSCASEHLGISPRTVRRWCDRGILDAKKMGRRWQIDMQSVMEVMAYGTEGLS